ncbi:2-hydroxychromene-2-carboxylate isomerase [Paraburkholderia sp. GAS334]|uniref:2-hydroxychromene-2-carboxylate isomerase n=1 Tax=Paraburkholderia sp. GAS334 TaxID=3035131 RepID=UPI003D1AE5CA
MTSSRSPRDNYMLPAIQFYFDFGSPPTYLASRMLPAIARDAGVAIDWRPVLLGGIFKSLGNTSPMDISQKADWMRRDLQQWARKWNVPFEFNPFFPVNTLTLQRGAVAYQNSPLFDRYVRTVFSAMWEKPQNLNDPATLTTVLSDAGFDANDFLKMVASPEVKARLRTNTEDAISRGVFGCPSFFVGGEMFFGQDRLDFVSDALRDVAR